MAGAGNRPGARDLSDADFIDAAELSADGSTNFRSGTSIVSTTASTKRVVLASGALIIHGDDPVDVGDKCVITGGAAAGTYTVAAVVDDDTFDVVEAIVDTSSVGTAAFRFVAGALKVGFNPTGLTVTSATNLQDAIADHDAAISSGGITESQHRTLRQLIHLAEEGGPFEGFASGAYQETLPAADPFPTSIIWWTDSGKTDKIVEETITYNANKTIATDEWKVYDTDGSTVLATVTDTMSYSGVFETSRTRTIA